MPVFTELRPEYDRTSFSCGVPVLDSYLKERARLDVKRGLCAVHVLAEGEVSKTKDRTASYGKRP
jgi:hypothetical protein